MPDARGDVLCPTCGRWTPPAPFCNECGAALQGDFRDPAGAEGSDVYRRGSEVANPGAPWSGAERFEPEPEDQAARGAAAGAAGIAAAAGAQRIDNLGEMDAAPAEPPWPAEPGLPDPPLPPADPAPPAESAPESSGVDATDVAAAAVVAAAVTAPKRRSRAKAAPPPEEPAAEEPVVVPPEPEPVISEPEPAPPPPPPPVAPPPVMAVPPPPVAPGTPTVTAGDGDGSDGGVTGLVFVLFLGLGILALLGGAIIGGVFEGGPSATASPSPTVVAATPTPEATPQGTTPPASASQAPTSAPQPSETPTIFPDGFIARVETCLDQPTDSTCANSGSVNDGEIWTLVSFRHGVPTDVIAVSIYSAAGDLVDGATIPLDFCGASTDCAGWTYFHFQNLGPGNYDVKAYRNGALAAVNSFKVE